MRAHRWSLRLRVRVAGMAGRMHGCRYNEGLTRSQLARAGGRGGIEAEAGLHSEREVDDLELPHLLKVRLPFSQVCLFLAVQCGERLKANAVRSPFKG